MTSLCEIRAESNLAKERDFTGFAGRLLTLFSRRCAYGAWVSVVTVVRKMWLSHRLLPRVSVVVLVIAAVELIGLAIYSFLLPVTG